MLRRLWKEGKLRNRMFSGASSQQECMNLAECSKNGLSWRENKHPMPGLSQRTTLKSVIVIKYQPSFFYSVLRIRDTGSCPCQVCWLVLTVTATQLRTIWEETSTKLAHGQAGGRGILIINCCRQTHPTVGNSP